MKSKSTKNDADELITFSEFREFMFKQIVPISDLKDYEGAPIEKQFPFWRRKNLLPFFPKGKHLDFEVSFIQMIWLRILDTLRSLSYPIGDIEKVADYFFKDAYLDHLPKKNIAYNKDLLEEKKGKGSLSEEEHHLLKQIDSFLADERLLYVLKFDVNYLSNLIGHCIATSLEACILIYANGRVAEQLGETIFSHKGIDFDHTAPHIQLSIKYYLQEFIDDEQLQRIIMPQILNDDEKYILKELRNDNIKELSIKKTGGKIVRVDIGSDSVITGDKAKEIKRILGLRNYEEITLSTRDENNISFKKRIKKINHNNKQIG